MIPKRILICPKCKSTDVSSNMSALAIGMGSFQNEHKCNKCGYESMFFPEIEVEKSKKNTKK